MERVTRWQLLFLFFLLAHPHSHSQPHSQLRRCGMLIPKSASDRHTRHKTHTERGNGHATRRLAATTAHTYGKTAMESKLPAPPSTATTTTSSRSAAALEPSKLPLPSRRRSRLQSSELEEDVSSSASTTSSPEVAVANGAMVAVPPRLELHDLTVHADERARVCASSDTNTAPGGQVQADAADAFLVHCHRQQLLLRQPTAAPRTGIPSLGMKKTLPHSRLTPGSTHLQTNGVEKQPSRIGRCEVRLQCMDVVFVLAVVCSYSISVFPV